MMTASVDPRFDPAFQRGFADDSTTAAQPAVPRQPVARQPYTERVRAQSAAVPPVPESPLSAPVTSSLSSAPLTSSPVSTVPVSESTDAAADADRDRRPNPFLIALGALSVVLVAAGVWGVQTARAPFLGTNVATDVDFVGLQILQVLAPMAIALGVATAIGIVFVLAVGWQKRRV